MAMPMRPYGMGLGYGMGNLGQENDYFGSADPGKELAGVMLQARASKRADEQAAAQEQERKSTAAWRDEQAARERAMDPINEAIARARLRGMGVRGPGETGGGGGEDVQGGLPPAGIMAGSRSAPLAGVQGARNGAGAMPDVGNRTQGMASGFMGPTGGAHTLPGAFNPDTGTHNRPDIDLGGGYSMPFSQTPEGRQGTSAQELLESGLLPNLTPAAAMYLSQHPEHIAALVSAERGHTAGQTYHPGTREEWMADERFRAGLPARGQEEKPEMSRAGALQEIDRVYGKGDTDAAIERLGGVSAREALAQRMMRRGFDPTKMPLAGPADASARFRARTGRSLPVGSAEEQAGDLHRDTRNRQIRQIRSMIPQGADPARVREILRSHGLTDEEIQGVTTSPAQPRAAVAGGGTF